MLKTLAKFLLLTIGINLFQAVPFTFAADANGFITTGIAEGTQSMTEGESLTLTVILDSAPTDTVELTFLETADITLSSTSLTFDASNWNVEQKIIASAVDDAMVETTPEGMVIEFASISADPTFNNLEGSAYFEVVDNDSAELVFESSAPGTGYELDEGDSITYTVYLISQPNADQPAVVSVDLTEAWVDDLSVDVESLEFNHDNWNTAQTITVTALDDILIEGTERVSLTLYTRSDDPVYNGLDVLFEMQVSDNGNDTSTGASSATSFDANLNVTTEVTSMNEGGDMGLYVVLTAQPISTVTVTLNAGSDLSLAQNTLTFTSFDWDVEQKLLVTAIDDTLVEGTEQAQVTIRTSSGDSGFDGIEAMSVITILDNDGSSSSSSGGGSSGGSSSGGSSSGGSSSGSSGSSGSGGGSGGGSGRGGRDQNVELASTENVFLDTIRDFLEVFDPREETLNAVMLSASDAAVRFLTQTEVEALASIRSEYALVIDPFQTSMDFGGGRMQRLSVEVDNELIAPKLLEWTGSEWVELAEPKEINTADQKIYVDFLIDHDSIYAVVVREQISPFFDTWEHWSNEYVEALWREFVIDGKSEHEFAPEAAVTRAEFLKMILNGLDIEVDPVRVAFTDLEADAWYLQTVKEGLAAGVITGYPDGTFRPNASINRAEAVAMLIRAAQITPVETTVSDYRDVNPSEWYADYIYIASAEGIVAGYGDGTFGPGNNLKRGEAAKIIYKVMGL